MGCYESPPEYEPGPAFHVPRVVHIREDAPAGGDGSTWETAYPTFAEALDVASTSDEIRVAGGRYNEPVFLERGIEVYGGFAGFENSRDERNPAANSTVIDATGWGIRALTGADGAVLDGFTVTGGNAGGDGGGISVVGGVMTVTNCIIAGNTSAYWGGGVALSDSGSTLVNCVIAGNHATCGGAIDCDGQQTVRIINCTIAENTQSYRGAVTVLCPLHVTNSILWNPGEEIDQDEENQEPVIVESSCVQQGWPGEGNIDVYPAFADPDGGLYRLVDGSPCVDRGNVPDPPPHRHRRTGPPGRRRVR